ncbi:L,D-transpeptidase [Blastochloris sulfoviridis]|uniref:L,D-transpeptidase n=1 Tax=Blastochloris sulfoviridis TaxID=50712 RepID=A0A5M6HZ67_9HYPH|nr:L,D-transpeptidase [Blastochloris sulfoviridis]KAA5601216.1 L,D-transpeptidase [Blastochloris sulfoviridis]
MGWESSGPAAARRAAAAAVVAISVVTTGLGAGPALAAREVVPFKAEALPGTIVVKTSERRLYYVVGAGRAIRYPVAVGMAGRQWTGATFIDGKHLRPAWSPPAEVKRHKPSLPNLIAGGAPGNPMGAAALTLSGGEYAIHGTSASMRRSIGSAASFGCIRMLDEDVLDLFGQVGVGTRVVVER